MHTDITDAMMMRAVDVYAMYTPEMLVPKLKKPLVETCEDKRGDQETPRTIPIHIDRAWIVPDVASNYYCRSGDRSCEETFTVTKDMFVTASTFDEFADSFVYQMLNEIRERKSTNPFSQFSNSKVPIHIDFLDMRPTGKVEEFIEIMASWNIPVESAEEVRQKLAGKKWACYDYVIDFTVQPRPLEPEERENVRLERRRKLKQAEKEMEDEDKEFEDKLKALEDERKRRRKKWQAVLEAKRAVMAKDEQVPK